MKLHEREREEEQACAVRINMQMQNMTLGLLFLMRTKNKPASTNPFAQQQIEKIAFHESHLHSTPPPTTPHILPSPPSLSPFGFHSHYSVKKHVFTLLSFQPKKNPSCNCYGNLAQFRGIKKQFFSVPQINLFLCFLSQALAVKL